MEGLISVLAQSISEMMSILEKVLVLNNLGSFMSTSAAEHVYVLNEATFCYIREREDKIRTVLHQMQQFVL
jgi:hypothetical protein